MDKGSNFFDTSVFGQLISLISDRIIAKNVLKCNSDYYFKRFKTKDHLISMLFCVLAKCVSLREVSGAMLGLSGKTKHFRLDSLPYRSTLSDANKRRDSSVFEQIYYSLLLEYQWIISDSRFKDVLKRQVEIFDSTLLTLFQEILKSVGRNPRHIVRHYLDIGAQRSRTGIATATITAGITTEHVFHPNADTREFSIPINNSPFGDPYNFNIYRNHVYRFSIHVVSPWWNTSGTRSANVAAPFVLQRVE